MAHYCVINHELRLIAVFSPKCASQTISMWFLGNPGIEAKLKSNMIPPHMINPREITDYKDYYKVLFLRNPLHRLVSFYAHWVVRDSRCWCVADQRRRFSLQGKTFRQFMFVLDHLSRHGLEYQHHLQPQVTNVLHVNFDRVILVEELDRGLQQLNSELGIEKGFESFNQIVYDNRLKEPVADRDPKWLQKNGTPVVEWFYDEELKEIAQNAYVVDIACYHRRE